MKHAASPDRRHPWTAFLTVLLIGVALVAWAHARPAAETAAPSPAPATAPAPAPEPAAVAPRPDVVPVEGAPPADGPVVPVALSIPTIDVAAVVEARGTVTYENPFTGKPVEGYGVPESLGTTSWWSDGPKPGDGRMAVLLGHAQEAGPAVFNRLHELRPGDRVLLGDSSGAVLTLEVLGAPLTGLDKATSALADALNGHPPGADLALVTCGGEFDPDAGASEDNTVVFARVTG